MSMISAQINELRKWADQLSERENEFGVVVRTLVAALRNAADTIWQLRDDLQRANVENAKLRDLLGRGAARPIVVADDGTDGATGSCRCGACGQPIDPWDRWCRHCGTEVAR